VRGNGPPKPLRRRVFWTLAAPTLVGTMNQWPPSRLRNENAPFEQVYASRRSWPRRRLPSRSEWEEATKVQPADVRLGGGRGCPIPTHSMCIGVPRVAAPDGNWANHELFNAAFFRVPPPGTANPKQRTSAQRSWRTSCADALGRNRILFVWTQGPWPERSSGFEYLAQNAFPASSLHPPPP